MRVIAFALGALTLCSQPAVSQTPQQLEQRISQLPPNQRAYERYRYWITMQPPDVQRTPDPIAKYRAYLQSQGTPAAEIDEQIKMITDTAANPEAQRWNRILTAEKPVFNTAPNAFLVDIAKTRKPGTAVDVGMGQGRNAIWLAQQGWTVTGFDVADQAVALARQNAQRLGLKLTTEITGMNQFDFGENRWNLILLSYVGAREIPEKVTRALKPGGVVVIESFHRDATRGRSIGPAVVFDTGELVKLFPDLRVVRYEEPLTVADFGQQKVRVVRYCGEKVP